MKSIIIQIKPQGIYFNDKDFIPWKNTNVNPELMKNIRNDFIFWEVKMLSFKKSISELFVSVVSYTPNYLDEFLDQKPKYPIFRVHFQELHWMELEPLLPYYKKSELSPLIKFAGLPKPLKVIHIDCKVNLKKITFHNGYVSCQKTLKHPRGKYFIKIFNSNLIKEFEHVKIFFAKQWKRKSIDLKLKLEKSVEWKVIKAHSPQINTIDENTIELLKYQKVDDFVKKKKPITKSNEQLFEFEDLLNSMNEDDLGNIDITEKELLLQLIQDEKIRNAKHLQYMVGKLHETTYPICFTLSNQFGFIFYVEGEEMNHFIWELLDSHATYLWSIEKTDYKKERRIIDQQIKAVLQFGRISYKQNFEPTDQLYFHVIQHSSINNPVDEHFPKWKLKLTEKLI